VAGRRGSLPAAPVHGGGLEIGENGEGEERILTPHSPWAIGLGGSGSAAGRGGGGATGGGGAVRLRKQLREACLRCGVARWWWCRP
jgi:hypothetical protein